MKTLSYALVLMLVVAFASQARPDDADLARRLVGTWDVDPAERSEFVGPVTYNANGTGMEYVQTRDQEESGGVRVTLRWSIKDGILSLASVASSDAQRIPVGLQLKDRIVSLSDDRLVFETFEGYGDGKGTRGVRVKRPADPYGILRQPIPEKLVVLTFDDGCKSHATFVAPLLKKLGFGATFYVSDAFGFRKRKDQYMTWDEIKSLDSQGFEVGNHTVGHGQLGASGLDGCVAAVSGLEDQCRAAGVTKPNTFCWPVYSVNNKFCPMLRDRGYLFARGGGERAYRPTRDNPFDAPSFTLHDAALKDPKRFDSALSQATPGNAVIFCFHGVPDLEHPQVGVEPVRFERLMQHLKDNHYTVIAMRDLARYVDTGKAGYLLLRPHELPWGGRSPAWGGVTRQGDKLYLCIENLPADRHLTLPNLTTPVVRVYYLADAKRKYSLERAPLAIERDDRGIQSVVVPQFSTFVYNQHPTVIVAELQGEPAATILNFVLPGMPAATISGNEIRVQVPLAADVTKLAPVYCTGSPQVTGQPASGTVRDFTTPQQYTITAPDGSKRTYTVTVERKRGAAGLSNPSFESFDVLTEHDDTMGRNPSGAMWRFKQARPGDEVGICHLAGPITAPPAPDGTPHAAFIRGQGNAISQEVTLDEGRYTVSFDVVKRRGYSPRSTPLAVAFDGAAVLTLRPEQIAEAWQRYATPAFSVTPGAHTLSFTLLDGDGMDLIDRVTIQPAK